MENKNVNLNDVAFSDEEISWVSVSVHQIGFCITGYTKGSLSYDSPCLLKFIEPQSIRILKWDIQNNVFVDYQGSLEDLREINQFDSAGNHYNLKGFTKSSEWIEIALQADSAYLLILDDITN